MNDIKLKEETIRLMNHKKQDSYKNILFDYNNIKEKYFEIYLNNNKIDIKNKFKNMVKYEIKIIS